MWSAIGQFGLFLAAALFGAGLAWQWRARRAWRREQALKREWNETLENVESIMSRRLAQAREAAASELAARDTEIGRLQAELEAARAEARRSSRAGGPVRASGSARASGPAGASGPVGSDGPLPKAPSSTTTPRRPFRPRARSATAGNGRGADDLLQIRGVGRVYARKLRELGYTTFLDIASWGPEEVERVCHGLDTPRARIERDGWISQARALHERLHGTEAPPE